MCVRRTPNKGRCGAGISIGRSGWDVDELEEGSATGTVGLLCVGKRALSAESSACAIQQERRATGKKKY